MEIGTGTVPEAASDRRIFRLDGVAPRNQAELGARYACVWLTPQMDRLFQEGASGRRRFLDRLVYAFEPSHAREVAAYEAAMAGRNRLLAEGRGDRVWLAGLEDSMARHAVAVSAARAALVARMNAAPAAGAFPAALLGLACEIGQHLAAHPAVETEDWLRGVLQANRGADAAARARSLRAGPCVGAPNSAIAAIPAARAPRLAGTASRQPLRPVTSVAVAGSGSSCGRCGTVARMRSANPAGTGGAVTSPSARSSSRSCDSPALLPAGFMPHARHSNRASRAN